MTVVLVRVTEEGLQLSSDTVTRLGLKPGDEVRLEIKPAPDATAVRHAAIRYVWRHLGDAVGTSEPAWNGEVWMVPLWVKGHSGTLGRLVISPEGEVLPDRSTTKEQLLEAIHAHGADPAAA